MEWEFVLAYYFAADGENPQLLFFRSRTFTVCLDIF